MRKAIIIIFAVAVLGVLGFYFNKQDTSGISSGNSYGGSSQPTGQSSSGKYKDGTFAGISAETPYGPVKISVTIKSGEISNVDFIEMPDGEARSRQITADSKEQLKLNAITAQSASIDFVTGATSTSYGYQESLQAALDQAAQS